MRLRSAAFIIPLFVAVVFGFASVESSWASCNTSTLVTTPDYASVNTCVGAAARNATVTVSAGSATWASTLNITKGLTLAGAGVGNTTITGSTMMINIAPDSTAIANGELIKVNGFTFDGGSAVDIFMTINGASGITGTIPWRFVLVGNNKFQNGAITSNGVITAANANNNGQLRGVIYNNVFDRCNIPLRVFSDNDTREWANTAFNKFSFGTEDTLYFEDNTIQWSSPYGDTSGNAGWIETGQGGRVSLRFNTWNMTNSGDSNSVAQEFWDVHGFQNWTGTVNSGQTGSMTIEDYGNTITTPTHAFRWINHRGSQGMYFNNTYSGTDTPHIDVYQYQGCGNGDISPNPTNYTPYVNNTYFFHNMANGSNVPAVLEQDDCNIISENHSFWNYNASFTGATGVGYGLKSAMPATCTTGVGYWVTDEGSWNTKLPANTSGQLYKCVSTNTWQLSYTPYTYPHPLRGGSSAPSPPAAPTNLTGVVQ